MSITFGSNMAALRAQRQLGKISNEASSLYERLSSGLRINRASDDAAGLSVASRLQSDTRVFTQGVRNFNDGISLLNVADGAIEQLSGIVIRLKELAEQAANGVYGANQRKTMDAEAQALSKEYFRIIKSTSFNGRGLFLSEFGELRLQGGYGLNGGIQSSLGGVIGAGTLSSSTTAELSMMSSEAVATGDLNGDGFTDIVTVGSALGGSASIRLGTGNGSFVFGDSYSMETGASLAVALADFNNDGVLDMVTGGFDSGNDTQMTVRLGTGNGGFGAATRYADGTTTVLAIAVGDVNNDGFVDLIGTEDTNGNVSVRLGTGGGTFGTATNFNNGVGAYGATLGDINNDGKLDLITAGRHGGSGFATAAVMLGNGNGTFATAVTYQTEGSGTSTSVVLGDLNNDGKLDLVTGGIDSAHVATVRLGTGSGTFGASVSYVVSGTTDYKVSLGDLNGDGNLDFIGGASTGIEVRLGTGSGTFGAMTSYNDSGTWRGLSLGDFNTDGILDVVAVGDVLAGTTLVRLTNTTSGNQPLLSFNLTSRADALQALSQFDHALNRLSTQRGTIGAFQSRVTLGANVLQNTIENYEAAAHQILDADIAENTARLVRTQILQQAAASVLAQANQIPALALKLLT